MQLAEQSVLPVSSSIGAVGSSPQAHWKDRFNARFKSVISFVIGAGMFLLALWVLRGWLAHVSWADLKIELAKLSATSLVLSTIFTFASFLALIGYEWYAVLFIGRRLSFLRTGIISFITQSVAHAIGFAIFVGATIRYKLYSRYNFTLLDVAKIQVFFTTTFGLGCLTLAGGTLLIAPQALVMATGIADELWRLIGFGLLLAVCAVLVWGTWFHRPVRIGERRVVLPSAKVVIIQIVLGVTDLGCVAAALYVLLPASLGLDYFHTLGIFVAAITLGLISHIPGSLGVFESAVLVLVDPQPEETAAVIGALIAFRAIYYILPLVIGSAAFGFIETRRWLGWSQPHLDTPSERPH